MEHRRPSSDSPSLSPSLHTPHSSHAPLPSPSLSPSITSLLNSTTTTATNLDYFDTESTTTTAAAEDYFNPPPTSAAATAPPFGNLLQPDPASGQQQQQQQQRPPKRPRSSSSSGETGMPPPPPRRDSSARPSSSHSASSSHPSSPPPPPPARRASIPPPPAPAAAAAPAPAPPSTINTASAGGSPLEPSIFNVEPLDEFTKEVADWLWGFCSTLPWEEGHVEVEAKIGVMIDTRARGNQRYSLPVPIETILTDDSGLRFQSNMTERQHKAFNQLLNKRVEEAANPSYPFAPVRYAHTREVDSFHEMNAAGQGGKRKVRVTRDQKDPNKVLRVVEKTRIADMNIFSPKRLFDWRVSVSVEMPEPSLPPTPATLTRSKDRISYSHQLFTVDLTQVSQFASATQPGKPTLHELEIEFKDARVLLHEAAKEQRGEENRYLEMVQAFLNNVRMLIRNASEP